MADVEGPEFKLQYQRERERERERNQCSADTSLRYLKIAYNKQKGPKSSLDQ
jgi:hypothetical protein